MDFKNIGSGFKNIFASKEVKEKEKVISQLVAAIKKQHSLYRKEILDWKKARVFALAPENPRRKLLIDLYDDILGDATIYGISENRKLRISNKAFAITNSAGDVDDEKTKLLQKSWFNDFVKHAVSNVYYGYTLLYPKKLDENGMIKTLSMVYRDHIVPETCEILKNTSDQAGIRFDEGDYAKWVVWLNIEGFLGLLDKAAPLWIFKKHSWQNWDEFEEMFGIPMRTAKTASTDPRVQAEIDKWLQDFGSSNWARLPEGVEFEIKESNSRDAFNVFNEKRKACNEELAFLFDGNAESSKDTGSRAKSETIIESTQDLIQLDDETRVKFIVQDELFPLLRRLGYPIAEDDQFIWNENKKSTPKERLEIFKGVKDLGYKVKREQIETELDVQLEDEAEPDPNNDPPNLPDPNTDPTKNSIENFKKPHIHSTNCGCEAKASYRKIDFTLLNALSADEEKFLKQYFDNPDSINWSYDEFKVTHSKLLEGLREGFLGVDTDFESEDHLAMELFQKNIHRFGVDKTLKEIMEMNFILKTSKDFAEYRKRVRVLFANYKEGWLRAEWEQAKATSRMGARYLEMMRDIDIAPFWRLVAVLDERTTKICDALHNKVFSKLDVKAWQFLPPNHWLCRSDAEDVLGSYNGKVTSFDEAVTLDPDGYARMVKQGFAVNWGDAKEVFTATQSYLYNTGVEPLDLLSLGFKDYGLNPHDRLKTSSLPINQLDFDSLVDRSGLAKMMSVFELPVWMQKEIFEAAPASIRNYVLDVLQNPDEVYWKEIAGKNYKSYYKFYKQNAVEVVTSFADNELANVISINDLEFAKVDQLRSGLLLYTPAEHIAYRKLQYEAFGKEFNKVKFDDKNGAFIVQHKLHGASELDNNLFTSEKLFELGKSVQLLPIGTGKSPDALVNDVEFEFKLLTNFKNTFNAVKREIKQASKQSSNVLLHLNNDFEINQLIRALIAAVKNDEKRAIKFISIITNDGKLYSFSRRQIESKEFINILTK